MARLLCPVARACGGCPTIDQSEDVVRQRKRAAVQARVVRAGGEAARVRWSSARSEPQYRNRIRLRIDEREGVTFFNPHKDRDCAVLEPALRTAEQELRSALLGCEAQLLHFSHVELRAPDSTGRAGVFFGTLPVGQGASGGGSRAANSGLADSAVAESPARNPDETSSAPAAAALERRLSAAGFLVAFEHMEAGSAGRLQPPLQRFFVTPEVSVDVPLGSFMQVNHRVNRALVEHVVSGIASLEPEEVVDLYCGAGNFTLPLAWALGSRPGRPVRGDGTKLLGVEVDPAAVHAARGAAKRQDLPARFESSDVLAWLAGPGRRWFEASAHSVVLCDAPRAGLRDAMAGVLAARPKHLVLCSCHPAGLERDLKAAVQAGYFVDRVVLFDMFAFTDHVEAVAWLGRCDVAP